MLKINEKKINVGIIGDIGSGKSTFLAALKKYAIQVPSKRPYNIRVNGPTKNSINEMYEALNNGSFPGNTQQERGFIFDIGNNAGFKLHVETQDRPGGDYNESLNPKGYSEALDYLCNCKGLIFLISVQPKDLGQNPTIGAENINELLISLSNRLEETNRYMGEKLPYRVSVCFTQYDDAAFFNFGRRNNLFIKEDYQRLRHVPVMKKLRDLAISPEKMQRFIRWFEDWENGMKYFDYWFYRSHINFSLVSSIGFYFIQDERGILNIDWDNCNNVEIRNQAGQQHHKIKTAPNFRPVGLFEPFAWLINDQPMDEDWFTKVIG